MVDTDFIAAWSAVFQTFSGIDSIVNLSRAVVKGVFGFVLPKRVLRCLQGEGQPSVDLGALSETQEQKVAMLQRSVDRQAAQMDEVIALLRELNHKVRLLSAGNDRGAPALSQQAEPQGEV